MKLILSSPAKALNKAYLKQSIRRDQIEKFRDALARLSRRWKSKSTDSSTTFTA